jgi:hypothetical protein
MVFSIKEGLLLLLAFFYDQYGSIGGRTVRVCTLWLGFVVGCALFVLFFRL